MHRIIMATKRKQWAADSMMQACNAVKNEQMGLREAAHKYNIPVETLRRQTTGTVSLNCKPGPQTTGTVSLNCRPGPQTTGTVSLNCRPGPQTTGTVSLNCRPGPQTTGTVSLNCRPGPQTTGTVSLNCRPGPQTTGTVSLNYRPGPRTVLTTEEEARLAQYQGWSQALGTSRLNWNCLSRIMNCSFSYISGNTI